MLNVVGESTHLRCECELLYDFIDDGVIWLKIIVERRTKKVFLLRCEKIQK